MSWLDSLKKIEPGKTIPTGFKGEDEDQDAGVQVVHFRTLDKEFKHIEKLVSDLKDVQDARTAYELEVERERQEADRMENDLKTQLHTARRDFVERIQAAAPEGWEIIVRQIDRSASKETTLPDIDTVRGIDRVETDEAEHDDHGH